MSIWLAPEKAFALVIATNTAGPDAEKALGEVTEKMVMKWLPHSPAQHGGYAGAHRAEQVRRDVKGMG